MFVEARLKHLTASMEDNSPSGKCFKPETFVLPSLGVNVELQSHVCLRSKGELSVFRDKDLVS